MRVFHGTTDAAGQAWEIVKTERKLGLESRLILFSSGSFGYGYDQFINLAAIKNPVLRRIKRLRSFTNWMPKYDIFTFYRGSSILPRFIDLLILKTFNKKIIMHFFGSEIRRLDLARKYPFHYADLLGFNSEKEQEKIQRVGRIKKFADVLIVPDYELLEYVPGAKIIPLTYDSELVSRIRPSTSIRNVIKIIHAPSNRVIKGTDLVIETVKKITKDLAQKYTISFELIENVKHEEALKAYSSADIVIDQLRLGIYATFAIECMSLSKPVICYIRPDLAKKYPDLPIVNADPNTLYEKLKELIENKKLRSALGIKGRKYVKDHHDPKVIARKLIKLYKS